MARAKLQANSRKEHVCGKGNHVIPKGDSYYYASPGFRSRTVRYRCLAHPFRPSELTTSMRSEPLSAIEDFEDQAAAGFDSIDDLRSAVETVAEAIRDYANQRQEALDQWENGNSQLEEYVETAEAAADEAEGIEV